MDEMALVYDAAAQRGIGWQECDAAEIWVLAAQLGANHADDEDEGDPTADPDTGLSWNQKRALALSRGEPEPQWSDVPMTAAELAGMQRLMGGIDPIMPPGYMPPA